MRDSRDRMFKLEPDFSISRRMTKEPFKNPADAAHLAASLALAGLPERILWVCKNYSYGADVKLANKLGNPPIY